MNEIKKTEIKVYCKDCGKYVGTMNYYGVNVPSKLTDYCSRPCQQLYVRGRCYDKDIKKKEMRNKMEIQIITETKAIYMPFAPVNKLSADEYNEMRKMLAEAEALGVIRDWSIY